MASTPLQGKEEDKAVSTFLDVARRPFLAMETGVGSSIKDEAIWKRLRDAGLDEEAIKRRDKAALIAYVAKLEAEIYDYQHHMGLLILEKKQWISKYEQIKAASDSAEMIHRKELAAQSSALSESRKQEESLKKALGIEKESIISLEKTLHEMRSQSAESKVAAEIKLSEARKIMEIAQKKLDEAEKKLREAESSSSESRRYERMTEIKLHDVEAREDELRRRLALFNSQCASKESEISRERQSLYESQKIMQQEQEKLLERESFLNQREDHLFKRLEEFSQLEKQWETEKHNLEVERKILSEERSNFALDVRDLAAREESIFERETLIDKKEKDLLIFQEKIATREHDEIQRLRAEQERELEQRTIEFEAKLKQRREEVDEEIERRRMTFEQKEVDLNQRIELILERENALELHRAELKEKFELFSENLKFLEDKELNLAAAERETEKKTLEMVEEKAEIDRMTLELERERELLEAEKNEVLLKREKLTITAAEKKDLFLMEKRLKEEIDNFRTQQTEIAVEAEILKKEKEKFEREWELIDEKREELEREASRIAGERESICQYLKNEQESLKAEKEELRNQFKGYHESLVLERENFICHMEREHSEWFRKIQREREDLMEDMNLQKQELENSITKRHDEVEAYMREKEEAFERERTKELQKIFLEKETIAREIQRLESEIRKFQKEKMEIERDREQREKEWSEIKASIEVLNLQREKLQEQRELLQVEREEIFSHTQRLKRLEDQSIKLEHQSLNHDHALNQKKSKSNNYKAVTASPPASLTLSWVRRCARIILGRSTTVNMKGVDSADRSTPLTFDDLHDDDGSCSPYSSGRKRLKRQREGEEHDSGSKSGGESTGVDRDPLQGFEEIEYPKKEETLAADKPTQNGSADVEIRSDDQASRGLEEKGDPAFVRPDSDPASWPGSVFYAYRATRRPFLRPRPVLPRGRLYSLLKSQPQLLELERGRVCERGRAIRPLITC